MSNRRQFLHKISSAATMMSLPPFLNETFAEPFHNINKNTSISPIEAASDEAFWSWFEEVIIAVFVDLGDE